MTEQAIILLLQIPLAGVVVFVVVLFLKHLREVTQFFTNASAEAAKVSAAVQEKQITMFMAAIERQRQEHIQSIREQVTAVALLENTINNRLDDMGIARAIRGSQGK